MSRFELLNDDAVLPVRSTERSAGYDLCASHDIFVPVGETVLVKTGLTISLADNEMLMVCSRSGLALKKSIFVLNAPGIVDADYYPNEIGVILLNAGNEDFTIYAGDRIAQGIITQFRTTEGDAATGERQGGFGSTGFLGKSRTGFNSTGGVNND